MTNTKIYKTVNTLSPTEAAYIAGIIDGEGTISLSKRHSNENRQLVVSISNTEIELLDYILGIVGAGRITSKRTYKANHTPSFTYAISNRLALNLLVQISSFLKTYKRHRAELVIKDYVRLTPRNGKYNNETLENRNKFVEKFFEFTP